MRLIDMHSHWKTKRGYPLRTSAELARQERVWRSHPEYATEEEMVEELRGAGVRVILDFGYTKFLPLEEARQVHDYGFEMQARYPDTLIGNWLHFQPELGKTALEEFKRCLAEGSGLVGLAVSGSGGVPPTDPSYDPFYRACIEANAPALIFVGFTGLGAGAPGGDGILLDHCHPRHVDEVAARYPGLTIIAARPAWPWQSEMIAVLLHKPNVWYELHGWSPKYLTDELKREIPRRLQDRVMFGADYPLLSYERLISDWKGLGLDDETLEKLFCGNAARLLTQLGYDNGPAA